MKQAILVTSFGTTHPDTLEKAILPTEKSLADAFPQWEFRRAFTSKTIRRVLREKQGLTVDSAEEALEKLRAEGFRRAIVQPTFLVPGLEYDRLEAAIQKVQGIQLALGKPLLWEPADLPAMIDLLVSAYPVKDDQLALFMGHGTYQPTRALYEELARLLPRRTGGRYHLCTVEGVPAFDDGIREVRALPQRKILLAPMLLVAGDHAKNDMAGDEPDSLRRRLEREGFRVSCEMRGLGELSAVRDRLVCRARTACEAIQADCGCMA